MYEIVYDYEDEHNLVEIFEGSWHELQDYIKQMRRDGCYNIVATDVKEEL